MRPRVQHLAGTGKPDREEVLRELNRRAPAREAERVRRWAERARSGAPSPVEAERVRRALAALAQIQRLG